MILHLFMQLKQGHKIQSQNDMMKDEGIWCRRIRLPAHYEH